MQPKNLNAHARIKFEPTRVQKQLECRLFGKTFRSIAAAARYYELSPSTAYEWHHGGMYREAFPKTERWDRWRTKHGMANTNSANAG